MTGLRRFLARTRELIARRRVDRELDEEVRHHLDLLTDEYVRRGLPRDAARSAARRSFGGVDQTVEAVRDRRGFRPVETLGRDLGLAARALARAPGFTSAAALTLALGIGVNAAIFSMVDAVLLRPAPYPDPARLVAVWEEVTRPAAGVPERIAVAPANLSDYRRLAGDVIRLAGYSRAARTLTGAGTPDRLGAETVTADYFATVGIQPALGRTFRDDEFVPGRDAVAIVTHRFWQARFGGDPSALGRTIHLDAVPTTIVGIMPAGFEAVSEEDAPVDLLLPSALPPDMLTGRGEHVLSAVGRVASGVTLATARERLQQVAASIAATEPLAAGLGVDLGPLGDDRVQQTGADTLLLVLLGAVSLVLLTACANIASLLVVRSLGRRREVAVRVALGAGRGRLMTHVAAESVVLAAIGAAAGGLLGYLTTGFLVSMAPAGIPRIDEVTFGARTLLFVGVAAAASALLFGLMPALQVSRSSPSDVLRASSRSIAAGWVRRSRSLFLGGQVALSIVLLVGALLMARSLIALNHVPLGFDPHGVLAAGVSLPGARYATPAQRLAFFEAVEARLAADPRIESVAFANRLPLRSGWTSGLEIEGRDPAGGPSLMSGYQAVSPGYRETFRVPLVRGRWIAADDRGGREPVAVVNEAFARELLGGRDPIGLRLRRNELTPWARIVGVVADMRRGGRTAGVVPQVYVPAAQVAQYPLWLSDLAVRAAGDARGLEPAIRDAIWAEDPDQPLTRVATLDETLRLGQADREFRTWLFLLFAALALALVVVGVYSIVSYAVSQQTTEIGVRMAMGASTPRILRWVVTQAAWPTTAGAAIGLVAAWGLSRFVSSLLFRIEATDAASYVLALAIVTSVAVGASLAAGRKATRVDAAQVLR